MGLGPDGFRYKQGYQRKNQKLVCFHNDYNRMSVLNLLAILLYVRFPPTNLSKISIFFKKGKKNKQHFNPICCLIIISLSKTLSMRKIIRNLILMDVLFIGSILGFIKGEEAKQKWTFKMLSRVEEKQQKAEIRKIKKEGGVLLDEVELSAYHEF